MFSPPDFFSNESKDNLRLSIISLQHFPPNFNLHMQHLENFSKNIEN